MSQQDTDKSDGSATRDGASEAVENPAREALQALSDHVEGAVRTLRSLAKVVKQALKSEASADLSELDKALGKLSKKDLSAIAPEPLRQKAIEQATVQLDSARKRLRLSLVGELNRAATNAGLEVSRLGADPPTFAIAPVTVELDFEREEARVLYAREAVVSCDLAADAILDARTEAMARIKVHGLTSPRCFDLLRRAYGMVLAASGKRPGERVDLVDLLAPMTLLIADQSTWRTLNLGRAEPFTRYQLAYYLQRLRRDGLLSHDGARLDLGTATGGTTRQKRNVLFVPSGRGEGQYYLSLRIA